jgi:GNAT superfamily N-acetyltransferase
VDLLTEMVAEMRALYAIAGPTIGVPLEPAELGPPTGVYLVGWARQAAAAGGGVRMITPGLAEIKRMYVRPDYRGMGVGRALLAALEEAAAGLGAETVRLDTGAKQPLAVGMYERSGYRRIGNWNNNPHASYWGEKRLT